MVGVQSQDAAVSVVGLQLGLSEEQRVEVHLQKHVISASIDRSVILHGNEPIKRYFSIIHEFFIPDEVLSDGGRGVAEDYEIIVIEIAGEDGAVGGVVVEAVGGVGQDHVDYQALEVGQGNGVVFVDVYDQVLVYYC